VIGHRAAQPGVAAGARAGLISASFTVAEVVTVRHQVREHCMGAGLTGDDLDDFVLAVHELVTNAVRHGGGSGNLDLHLRDDTITCEIRDDGRGTDMLVPHLPAGDIPGGRGLWLAHHLTEGLMITAGPGGVSATVTVCLTPTTPSSTPTAGVTLAYRAGTDAGTSLENRP
jgi:serine/threonine-protein kinase RsbW